MTDRHDEIDYVDRLVEIERKLNHPELCFDYYSSQRWNDLVWCVAEIKRLRRTERRHRYESKHPIL